MLPRVVGEAARRRGRRQEQTEREREAILKEYGKGGRKEAAKGKDNAPAQRARGVLRSPVTALQYFFFARAGRPLGVPGRKVLPATPGKSPASPRQRCRNSFPEPKMALDRTKRAPRALPDGTRWPRHAERSFQDARDGLQKAQEAVKTTQEAPKRRPKRAPRGKNRPIPYGKLTFSAFSGFPSPTRPRRPHKPPRSPQDAPTRAPRRPQTAPGRPQRRPRRPKRHARQPQEPPKTAEDGPKTAQGAPKTA